MAFSAKTVRADMYRGEAELPPGTPGWTFGIALYRDHLSAI